MMLIMWWLPGVVSAADDTGLVPCSGTGGDPCQACSLVQLVQNVFEWLAGVSFVIVVLIIIISGVILSASGGDAGAQAAAKRRVQTAIIGYVIFLACWFVIDIGLKSMLNASYGTWEDNKLGPWYQVVCVDQPEVFVARPTASGKNEKSYTDPTSPDYDPAATAADYTAINNSIATNGVSKTAKEIAATNGLTSEYEQKIFQALIMQESSNCQNKVGPTTNYGKAYGCGQLLVGTAKEVALANGIAAFNGMNTAQIANELQNNDALNMQLSALYLKKQIDKYGSVDSALASYNGGDNAMKDSKDCSGSARWQCEVDCDSAGQCKPNTGYKETRNYVANIKAVAAGINN